MFDRFNTLPLISVTLINLWQNEVKGAHYIQICGHLIRLMCHINFLLLNLHPFYCDCWAVDGDGNGVRRMALPGQKREKELPRTQTFPTVSLHDMSCVLSVIRLHWFRRNFAWLHLSLPECGELIDASGDHKCPSLSSMLHTVVFWHELMMPDCDSDPSHNTVCPRFREKKRRR